MAAWVDWAGLAVGVIGFAVTIWQVIEARRAAVSARDAATLAREAAEKAVGAMLENIEAEVRKTNARR